MEVLHNLIWIGFGASGGWTLLNFFRGCNTEDAEDWAEWLKSFIIFMYMVALVMVMYNGN